MALPKKALQTVSFVDEYCAAYKNVFPEVRTFENFKFLHLGIMSELKRKSLTEISKVVGLKDSQPLNNFLKNSPWDVRALRQERLMWVKQKLNERSFVLAIDEIGGKKKGKTTDYVAKQYIGQLAQTQNAIVSVNAYGIFKSITFPLIFKVFKPQRSLGVSDNYYTKPQLAIQIIKELKQIGLIFDSVIVDKSYCHDPELQEAIAKLSLKFIAPERSNERKRILTEPIVGEANSVENSLGDRQTLLSNAEMLADGTEIASSQSQNSTWYLPQERRTLPSNQNQENHNFFNLVECRFKQVKHELGWGDFRVTNYGAIEKWWEIVFSVYWMISLQSDAFNSSEDECHERRVVDTEMMSSIYSSEGEKAWRDRLTSLQSMIEF